MIKRDEAISFKQAHDSDIIILCLLMFRNFNFTFNIHFEEGGHTSHTNHFDFNMILGLFLIVMIDNRIDIAR